MVTTNWGTAARQPELVASETTWLEDKMVEAKAFLGSEPKFEPSDMDTMMDVDVDYFSLNQIACEYAARYVGTFDYMLDMRSAFQRWGQLSNAQAKGVANCMLAAVRRRQPATESKVQAAKVTEAGMYKTADGTIYKVQVAVHGSGNLYAKKLVAPDEFGGKATFEYAAGALKSLTPEMRMTLEEAKAFGALYGTCCVCGRTLTDEKSIEAGIGPICSGRL